MAYLLLLIVFIRLCLYVFNNIKVKLAKTINFPYICNLLIIPEKLCEINYVIGN